MFWQASFTKLRFFSFLVGNFQFFNVILTFLHHFSMYKSSNNNLTAEHRSVSFMPTHLRSANIILTLTCSNNLQAHATMLNPISFIDFYSFLINVDSFRGFWRNLEIQDGGPIWLTFRNHDVIGHFTVVCLVTWPLSGSEAGGDLVLIQTLLLFTCKSCCSHAN